MTSLRSLLDAGDARFRRAAGLFAAAALVALVPLGGIAYVLVRAANGPPDRGTIVLFTFVVLASAAVQLPLAAAGSRLLRSILDERAERARVDVVEHLRLVPARTLAAIDPGQVLATMTLGLDQAIAVVNGAFDSIFGGLFKAAGCIAIVAAIDWRIALVSLAFLPVTVGYLRRSRTSSSRATARMVRAQAEGASRFYEYVESVALLRAFGCTAERVRRLAAAVEDLNVKAFENTLAPMTFGTVSLFFIEFGFAIALTFGIEIGGNAVGIRYILAFTLAMAYFQTFFEALDGYLRLRDAASPLAAIDRLMELPAAPVRSTTVPAGRDLALDRVTFAYDRGDVLRDVSFLFPERAVTAIVGASGAGKSTLANVISGIWEPSDGSVRVGGVDVGTLAQDARASTVSIVFQDAPLFEDTVARNIGAGTPERDDGRDPRSGAHRRLRRVCVAHARRIRDRDSSGRHEPFARRAPAHRDRAHAAVGGADRRARRVHGEPRPRCRARRSRRNRPACQSKDRRVDHASARHGPPRLEHRRHGRRPDRRVGHARATDRAEQRVRALVGGARAHAPLESRRLVLHGGAARFRRGRFSHADGNVRLPHPPGQHVVPG